MDEARVPSGNDVGWNTRSTDEVIVRHDQSGRNTLAITAVTATAQLHGVDTIDLPPLSEAIDPDALCQLFVPSAQVAAIDDDTRRSIAFTRGRVGFRYAACGVIIWTDGTVIVTPV